MSDAQDLHAQQVAYWNGPAVSRWISRQEQMDAGLAPVAEAAISLAAVTPGEHVLDIGCGSGATSLALARLVGPTGQVTGLDVSAPMIELARSRLAGHGNLTFELADAAAHKLPAASADLLFSRFGVMFFGDPAAAFANLRQALKPSGRLVLACWRPLDENLWMLVPLQAVQPLIPPLPRPNPEEPSPFAFGDTRRVTRILTSAGFAVPGFTKFDMAMHLGAGLDEAVEQGISFGATARALQGQPDSVVQAAKEAVRTALAPHLTANGIALPGAIWLIQSAPAK
jgi:SAM-dependent methyltransferase